MSDQHQQQAGPSQGDQAPGGPQRPQGREAPPGGPRFGTGPEDRYVVLHTLGWQTALLDESGEPVKAPGTDQPTVAAHTYRRGDVVTGAQLHGLDVTRLARVGAVARAEPEDRDRGRVDLEPHEGYPKRAGAALASRDEQLRASEERVNDLQRQLDEARGRAQPPPAGQGEGAAGRLQREQAEQLQRLQAENEALRRAVEDAQRRQAAQQQPKPPEGQERAEGDDDEGRGGSGGAMRRKR